MKFTFVVLSFNHENFILEHLESIKFQINNFGKDFKFQLIVADDGSSDQTLKFVNHWISQNSNLFYDIKVLADGVNRGTCFNYTKSWPEIDGSFCKITAGDDVYSFINLFANLDSLKNNEIFSGLPLLLIDGYIKPSRSDIFHILATDVLYRKFDFAVRLMRIGTINAPNIFLSKKIYSNERVVEFIRRFSVTEDLPLFISLSREYKPLRFFQSSDINVYYRRTKGSTYLVRQDDFNKDKVKLYHNLLTLTQSTFEKILLRNRLVCFSNKNQFLKIILNLNYYLYLFKILLKINPILKAFFKVKPNLDLHQEHANLMRQNAEFVQSMLNNATSREHIYLGKDS